MLLPQKLRTHPVQRFICRKCISKFLAGPPDSNSLAEARYPLRINSNTRRSLRIWEEESRVNESPILQLPDIPPKEEVGNVFTRPTDDFEIVRDDGDEVDDNTLIYDGDELLDVGHRRRFLLPGDLVELLFLSSHKQELAIYIRELENQSQFYTISGRWVHRKSHTAQFYVPNFVERHELDDLRPFLPDCDVPDIMRDRLHSFEQQVPRDIGKPLVKKMRDFWDKADAVYQAAAHRLDAAHGAPDGNFPKHALYAVHRSIIRDEIGFKNQNKGSVRTGGQYEINSVAEVKAVYAVVDQVRIHRERKANIRRDPSVETTNLDQFAERARVLIDLSRKTREFSVFGTIGPSSKKIRDSDHLRTGNVVSSFNATDIVFLRFLESWAALSSFGLQSSLHGIGADILRAIGRYNGAVLDQTTAWTCLQELGVIAPWENRASFELRLPLTGLRHHQFREPIANTVLKGKKDSMLGLRRDWGDLPVYCIDDIDAHEIDDGISIESTDHPDEYWVHVHTADPAAYMLPRSAEGQRAEHYTETIYMPDRVIPMLSKQFVDANLSLAPDRPCLTFSARMNTNGDLLENKITPGIVRDVKFISPVVVDEVLRGVATSNNNKLKFVVGNSTTPTLASRPMLESHQLLDVDKSNLHLLQAVGEGRKKQRKARGGLSGSYSRPSLSVSFNGSLWKKGQAASSRHYYGDPTIQIVTDPRRLGQEPPENITPVQSLMLVAGEVAAQWCKDRGIPVPYRVTPRNPELANPADFFRDVVLPSQDKNGNPPPEIVTQYIKLLGPVLPTTTPAPHVAIGVDMMAKCTSPLRRYADLLLHWQVEAALRQEAKLGKSLIGNSSEDFLPFSKAQVDALLPRLDEREKIIRKGKFAAEDQFIINLIVRAWHFKECPLPSSFEFIVHSIDQIYGYVTGSLSPFMLVARFQAPPWIKISEISPEDVFEVELEDVNVYTQKIHVKALRRVELGASVQVSLAVGQISIDIVPSPPLIDPLPDLLPSSIPVDPIIIQAPTTTITSTTTAVPTATSTIVPVASSSTSTISVDTITNVSSSSVSLPRPFTNLIPIKNSTNTATASTQSTSTVTRTTITVPALSPTKILNATAPVSPPAVVTGLASTVELSVSFIPTPYSKAHANDHEIDPDGISSFA
ncbi:hypothetical protein B7494_g2657 [Chlorociboria aeruginascens]|nr:hypothetical protein B7494_g2657 [Chlorociboria aeruginascens]